MSALSSAFSKSMKRRSQRRKVRGTILSSPTLGVLIGDGALNYRRERILETCYAFALNKALTLTADYQLITNPAYNADRGPVHVFSGRFHAEF